jgi:4-hydroxy-2-oxoheptanedioate aldolase
MTVIASLATRLSAGEALVSAWCGLPEPMIPGLLAREDFDAVTIDMQHGSADLDTVIRAVPLVQAAGKPLVARIPVGAFATASRLLDAGVSGVIAPMINSVEDARRFASFMKFPPMGERSWGAYAGLTASGLSGTDYLKAANGFSVAFAMIETREAMAALDDILAVPGIDGVFIGPSDLSIALSGGTSVNPSAPEVTQAIAHVISRARAVNKPVAVYAHIPERAAELLAMGARFVTVTSDSGMLKAGAQAALKVARGG